MQAVLRSLTAALPDAVLTLLAALVTLGCTWAIAPEPGPAVLAVVLCLSLSRSQLDRDLRGRIEAGIALPLVSIAAMGVAWLLHHLPLIGAVLFVLALSASIWLRRFGPMGRKAGTLIALPFVTILITPYAPPRHVSPALALAMPVIVALLALFWVSVAHALAQRLGGLPAPTTVKAVEAPTPKASQMRPMPSTRMAAQMGVALALAFAVGHLFFAQHWGWVVLTAFIVNSGNQGRLDVAYKSGLRLLGAGAGTVVALLMSQGLGGHDAGTVALMLASLFMGLWLRPLGYGWWALFITLTLALLQGFEGASSAQALLGQRLLAILIGAVIGVAAAWFVWPIKSTDVLRRRMGDALAALAEATDPATVDRKPDRFVTQLAAVKKIAPGFRAARFLGKPQAADWIATLLACEAPAVALIDQCGTPRPVRKAIGGARLALKTPETIAPALAELLKELQAQQTHPA